MNIFSQSTGIFPDKMGLAKVSPIFKNGKKAVPPSYRPCYMYFHVFKKILESIIIIFCLISNSDFGQIIQLNMSCQNQMIKSVKCLTTKKHLFGIFIDLSKACDTVDHKILMKKLEHYGMNTKNLLQCKNYLTSQKEYIQYHIIILMIIITI